jgi:hypothetical protein
MILVGWAAINDDVWHTALGGEQWERCCRIDRKSRAKRYYQVATAGDFGRLLQVGGIEILTEADRSRLKKAAAMTQRWFPMNPKKFVMRLRVSSP